MASFTIQLHHLRFFAAHGLFAEETLTGNEFDVNIALSVKAPKEKITAIEDTINYAAVYSLVKEIFARRQDLLETIAMDVAEQIKAQFPAVRKLSVQITKLHPPIAGFTGSVAVTYRKRFKE